MYETAKETLMYRTVLWTPWERERVGRFGRMALKHPWSKDGSTYDGGGGALMHVQQKPFWEFWICTFLRLTCGAKQGGPMLTQGTIKTLRAIRARQPLLIFSE